MNLIYETEIPGRAYVKKNTQRVVGFGKSKRAIYSPQYTAWARTAHYQVKRDLGFVKHGFPFSGPVRLECLFYFANHASEPDLSALYEGIQDVLETAEIIVNDRQVQSHDGSRKLFNDGPARTVVRVYALA